MEEWGAASLAWIPRVCLTLGRASVEEVGAAPPAWFPRDSFLQGRLAVKELAQFPWPGMVWGGYPCKSGYRSPRLVDPGEASCGRGGIASHEKGGTTFMVLHQTEGGQQCK